MPELVVHLACFGERHELSSCAGKASARLLSAVLCKRASAKHKNIENIIWRKLVLTDFVPDKSLVVHDYWLPNLYSSNLSVDYIICFNYKMIFELQWRYIDILAFWSLCGKCEREPARAAFELQPERESYVH
jgi:hypothetical protein